MRRPNFVAAWIAVAVVGLAALWLLPLRLALIAGQFDAQGLSARAVGGRLWSGRLLAAEWRGLALGDIDVGLKPLALATATLRFELSGDQLRGEAWRRRGGGGVGNLSGRVAVAGLAGLPIEALVLERVDIGFRNGACTTAAGRLSLQPGGALARFGPLAGEPRCEGSAVLLPLESPDGAVRLELRVKPDTGFRARIEVAQVDEATRLALLAKGFQPTPQGLGMDLEGRL